MNNGNDPQSSFGNDYYFWLGDDGESRPVTKEEFEEEQRKLRQNLDDFLNVRIRNED